MHTGLWDAMLFSMNTLKSLELINLACAAALVLVSPAHAQNITGVPREMKGGQAPSMLRGNTDADRWNTLKEILPTIIGMSYKQVETALGKCTMGAPEGDTGNSWIYQITEDAKNPAKAQYLCILLSLSFENGKVVKCTIEPLWGNKQH